MALESQTARDHHGGRVIILFTMHIFHYIQNLRAYSSNPEHARTLLALYWRILLGSTCALVLAVFIYGGWQLVSIMNDAASMQSSVADHSKSAPINTPQVDTVLRGFVGRQAQFEELKTKAPAITDPGI